MKEKNNIILLWFVIILIIGIFFYQKQNKEEWTGVFYPNGCISCEEDWIVSPILLSHYDCAVWAQTLRQQRQELPGSYLYPDTYECGLNCKLDKEWDIYICEVTW